MSNGTGGSNCGEVVRSGNYFYVLDTKDNEPFNSQAGRLGPLAIYAKEEYDERLARVKETRDATHLFDSPEQHDTLTDTEMKALAAYIGAGALDSDNFEDGMWITARECMSDLTPEQQAPYLFDNMPVAA